MMSRRSRRNLVRLFVSIAAGGVAALVVPASARAMDALVPAYFYPAGAGDDWSRMTTAAKQISLTAIMNPGNGPGTVADSSYVSAVSSLRGAGGRVVGYIYSDYGNRSLATLKSEVDTWARLYPIDGIFVDEMANDNNATHQSYYAQLYAYIKSKSKDYVVVGNPGSDTLEAYAAPPSPGADTFVTYEGFAGYGSDAPAAWTSKYPSSRFSNLPYEVTTAATMSSYLPLAAARNVGHMYVTDDGADGNPWDRLPSYWESEVAGVLAITPTWNFNGSGDWNVAARWSTNSVPNAVNATAKLTGAPGQAATVFSNSAIKVGTLTLNNSAPYVLTGAGSLTLDVSTGSALIDVRRGSHKLNLPLYVNDNADVRVATGATLTVADPMNLAAGVTLSKFGPGTLAVLSTIRAAGPATIKINGGTVNFVAVNSDPNVTVSIDPATVNISGEQSMGPITLDGGGNVLNVGRDGQSDAIVPARLSAASLRITSGKDANLLDAPLAGNTTAIAGALSVESGGRLVRTGPGLLRAGSISIAADASLDVTDGTMVIDSGGATITSVRALLTSGRNGGDWRGAGLTSSRAANTPGAALGYGVASELHVTSVNGEAISPDAVIIRYTRAGDADLSGTVDLTDFTYLAADVNRTAGADWINGDFNYDGRVDLTDFTMLAGNFNQLLAPPSVGSAVPEPSTAAVMSAALALAAASGRRRRAAR